jgi:hypothetical protein
MNGLQAGFIRRGGVARKFISGQGRLIIKVLEINLWATSISPHEWGFQPDLSGGET